ncbi:MAG: hypothetical protein ACLQEQ_04475 [Nitrososphaerales archaeon]
MKPLCVVVLLLAATLVFAFLCLLLVPNGFSIFFPQSWLAYSNKATNAPACVITSGYISCPATLQTPANAAGEAALYNEVYWFNIMSWSSQGSADVAMGFATLAVLLLFVTVFAKKLKRFDRKINAPRPIRDVGRIGAMSGLGVFAVLAFADDASIGAGNLSLMGPLILRNFYVNHVLNLNNVPGPFNISVIGEIAFIALSVAISFRLVCRLEQGVLTAFSQAVTLFAAPAVMVFEMGLFIFGPITMPLQVANILLGTPLAGILTNWFVLVVSSGLFALGLSHKRLGL